MHLPSFVRNLVAEAHPAQARILAFLNVAALNSRAIMVLQLRGFALLLFFPQLALWLPAALRD